jgi:hypothetical protein
MQFSIRDELERAVDDGSLNVFLAPGGVVDIDLVFSGDELPALFILAISLSRHRGMVLPYVPHLIIRRRAQLSRLQPTSEKR